MESEVEGIFKTESLFFPEHLSCGFLSFPTCRSETPNMCASPTFFGEELTLVNYNELKRYGEAMNLLELEEVLGVKHGSEEECTLPIERWKQLRGGKHWGGTRWLMSACQNGDLDCVELLLRCGADVNILGRGNKRAVDWAVDGDHADIALHLFRRDSLLPDLTNERRRARFLNMLERNAELARFFDERDGFHLKVRNGEVESLDEELRKTKGICGTRYFIDRSGNTALNMAAISFQYDTWAYLTSKGFVYAGNEETERKLTEGVEDRKEFQRSIEKYFFYFEDAHVNKMLSRSRVVGSLDGGKALMAEAYHRINEERMGSNLLRFLQDVRGLEVIFDARIGSGIRCAASGVRHLFESSRDRVYVPAGGDPDIPDLVLNLAHGLCHAAMMLLFDNSGLPYERNDRETKVEFDREISRMISKTEWLRDFYEIISIAASTDEDVRRQEVIASVPALACKYKLMEDVINLPDGDLDQFYSRHVESKMADRVANEEMASLMTTDDLMAFPVAWRHHGGGREEVRDGIEAPKPQRYESILVHRVSNLRLGLRHLAKHLRNIVVVDWKGFERSTAYFENRLSSGVIRNLAIVWEVGEEEEFRRCVVDLKSSILWVDAITLVVPNRFQLPGDIEPFDYRWVDLSEGCKSWVLGKRVLLLGARSTVGGVLKSIVGGAEIDMDSILEPDDLSKLIDVDGLILGRTLRSGVEQGRRNPAVSDPGTALLPRALRVGPLVFSKELFQNRTMDAFVFLNADLVQLAEVGVTEVCDWNDTAPLSPGRCFLLARDVEEAGDRYHAMEQCAKGFKTSSRSGIESESWKYLHFFNLEDGKYCHLRSDDLRTSGIALVSEESREVRSIWLEEAAYEANKGSPEKWVLHLDLSKHGENLQLKLDSLETPEDFLLELSWRESLEPTGDEKERRLEKLFFRRFCQTAGMVDVFLDGYVPTRSPGIAEYLNALISKTRVRIFLAVAEYNSRSLEERFGALSHVFVPLEDRRQDEHFSYLWYLDLRTLSPRDRSRKASEIISSLQSQQANKWGEGLSGLVESLEYMANVDRKRSVDFSMVAERVVPVNEALCSGVTDPSESSLITNVLAKMVFEQNFALNETLTLHELFDWYVCYKIDLARDEKGSFLSSAFRSLKNLVPFLPTRDNGMGMEDEVREGGEGAVHRLVVLESLKKLAAYSLLKDEGLRPTGEEIREMVRTGFVKAEKNETSFHKEMFANYLFLRWLFDRDQDNIYKETLPLVLLESRFEGVRETLDSLLKSDRASAEGYGSFWNFVLSPTASDSQAEFKELLQKTLFRSIFECREGILLRLADISEDSLSEVLFRKSDWDMGGLDLRSSFRDKKWDVLTFCGACAVGTVFRKEHARCLCGRNAGVTNGKFHETKKSRLEQFRFLPRLLAVLEERGFLQNLVSILSEEGLWWLGLDSDEFWQVETGRSTVRQLLDFLARNKGALSGTLELKLCGEDGKRLLANAAAFSLEALDVILTSILCPEDLPGMIMEEDNFCYAWTHVVSSCNSDRVEGLWWYLKRKLITVENRKLFLCRKDRVGGNTLLASFVNLENMDMVRYVWGLLREELDEQEIRNLLLNTFEGVDYRLWFHNENLFDWLAEILKTSFLDLEQANRLLLSQNLEGEYYLLHFHFPYSPSTMYHWQSLFLQCGPGSREVLTRMCGHYRMLPPSCFQRSRSGEDAVDYVAGIEREFGEMVPSIFRQCPWNLDPVQCLESEHSHRFVNAKTGNMVREKIQPFQFKEFLVLLSRQMLLESGVFAGSPELSRRLEGEWLEMFQGFPKVRITQEEYSRSLLVPYVFAVVSKILSKEEVARMLQVSLYSETAFHKCVSEGDLRAFDELYDIARWSMGEDALWLVHSLSGYEDRTVLRELRLWQNRKSDDQ